MYIAINILNIKKNLCHPAGGGHGAFHDWAMAAHPAVIVVPDQQRTKEGTEWRVRPWLLQSENQQTLNIETPPAQILARSNTAAGASGGRVSSLVSCTCVQPHPWQQVCLIGSGCENGRVLGGSDSELPKKQYMI